MGCAHRLTARGFFLTCSGINTYFAPGDANDWTRPTNVSSSGILIAAYRRFPLIAPISEGLVKEFLGPVRQLTPHERRNRINDFSQSGFRLTVHRHSRASGSRRNMPNFSLSSQQ